MLKYTKKDFPEKENVRVKCLINTKIIHHENKKYEKVFIWRYITSSEYLPGMCTIGYKSGSGKYSPQ
ncbi:hypothetical protein CE91St19_31210 [Odoribacter laneus]|nr:hypothetical protein CE91St19_31210 [Odoribacter laneus]GKI27022.1 hypothetical protein CE91St20_31590 [Odoribacter laneus]